jgi:DNA-binding transcriptional regulator YhcF (GntR family)
MIQDASGDDVQICTLVSEPDTMVPVASERTAKRRRGSPGRRPVSWTEVEKAILLRIVSGVYEPGQQLPSCSQLASEVGANKNTVSKAYRSLAERGYLRTRAGSGTFVARRPARSDSDQAVADVANLLALVVQEAKMAGLQRQQFLSLIDDSVARFYDPVRPRVGFIDCNRLDATTLSRDLQVALSHPVEPLLIEEVAARPADYMARFHILAMNLSHLAAVEQILRGAVPSGGAEIIGLLVPTDPESLTQVARLRPGTHLGIVCDLTATLEALGGLVRGYNPGITVSRCLSDDEVALVRLLDEVDVLLVTPSASARVRDCEPRSPIIEVSFKPDERSVHQLGALIGGGAWRDQDRATSQETPLDVIQVDPDAPVRGRQRRVPRTGALAGNGSR